VHQQDAEVCRQCVDHRLQQRGRTQRQTLVRDTQCCKDLVKLLLLGRAAGLQDV
jgi:hypothetical protein